MGGDFLVVGAAGDWCRQSLQRRVEASALETSSERPASFVAREKSLVISSVEKRLEIEVEGGSGLAVEAMAVAGEEDNVRGMRERVSVSDAAVLVDAGEAVVAEDVTVLADAEVAIGESVLADAENAEDAT